MLKNKKILVFGSSGYLGSKFCESISKDNIIHKPQFKKNITKNGEFYFKKINSLIRKNKYTHIVNFHAHTDIEKSNVKFQYDFYHNCSITHSIVKSLINNSSKIFFLNIGTVTQVGYTNISSKIDMNFSSNPNNIFDLHKQYNEDFLKIMKRNHNIKCTTLRLSNIFGLSNKKISSSNRGIINKLIENAIKKNVITLYNKGLNIRDYIYIDDAVKGIILALKFSNKLRDDFYYLSSGKGISFIQFANILKDNLKKIFNTELKIINKNWQLNIDILNKRNFVGNPNNFSKITGWKPAFNLNKAILDYIKKFKV